MANELNAKALEVAEKEKLAMSILEDAAIETDFALSACKELETEDRELVLVEQELVKTELQLIEQAQAIADSHKDEKDKAGVLTSDMNQQVVGVSDAMDDDMDSTDASTLLTGASIEDTLLFDKGEVAKVLDEINDEDEDAATRIQSLARGVHSRAQVDKIKQDKLKKYQAAVKLQSQARGVLARSRLLAWMQEWIDLDDDDLSVDAKEFTKRFGL